MQIQIRNYFIIKEPQQNRYYYELISLNEKNNVIMTKIVQVNDLKEKGLINRIHHYKKVQEWFNTIEGLRWIKKQPKETIVF